MESDSCRQRPRIVSHVRASNREEQRCESQITIQTTLATKREQLNRPGQDSTVTLLTQSSGYNQVKELLGVGLLN